MTRATAEAFVRNLKALNAKERDHLMRFAYLGEEKPYGASDRFLSPAATNALRKHATGMELSEGSECVFAGMDYHLDWIHAALWTARRRPESGAHRPSKKARAPFGSILRPK